MRRGSAVLYVIFSAIITGMIIAYTYTRLASSNIVLLAQYNNIKEMYGEIRNEDIEDLYDEYYLNN